MGLLINAAVPLLPGSVFLSLESQVFYNLTPVFKKHTLSNSMLSHPVATGLASATPQTHFAPVCLWTLSRAGPSNGRRALVLALISQMPPGLEECQDKCPFPPQEAICDCSQGSRPVVFTFQSSFPALLVRLPYFCRWSK